MMRDDASMTLAAPTTALARKSRWVKPAAWLGSVTPYAFLLPAFAFILLFTYFPLVRSLELSLFEWNAARPIKAFVGGANYALLWRTPLFWKVLQNSLIFLTGTLVPSTGLALGLALLINRRLRWIGFYRFALFYPVILPTAAAAMIWLSILSPGFGLANILLRELGLPTFEWLGDRQMALPCLMVITIWKTTGFFMVIFLAGLQNIPGELFEACTIEGANAWQRFWYVTFPLLSPTTFFVVLTGILTSFQSIDFVYILTDGGPADATNVIVYYIYQYAFRFWDIGVGAALTSILFFFLLLVIVFGVVVLQKRVFYE
jgi:ABC-type sugar transport system permease subunit